MYYELQDKFETKAQKDDAFSFVKVMEKFFSVDVTIKLFGKPIFEFHFPPKT